MNIVIVEDEKLAAEGLWAQIQRLRPNATLLARLESVAASVEWFTEHQSQVDLAFFDIQLGDGLSFAVAEKVVLTCPVIFTTAYDQYALRAFSWHSIDYLLKPVEPERLEKALDKWERQTQVQVSSAIWNELKQVIQRNNKFVDRFLIRSGDTLMPVAVDDIGYFFSEHKITWLVVQASGKKYGIQYSLDQLESMLDPHRFIRLNRSCIGSLSAIRSLTVYSGSRLKAILSPNSREEVVSRERVSVVKAWLGQ